jgi:glycosyltransferase involved in cell wall biosynthesis
MAVRIGHTAAGATRSRLTASEMRVRFLFLHQNFPGQYLHIVRHLLADRDNDVVFISEPNANVIAGVRRVSYQMPKLEPQGMHVDARDFNRAAWRAAATAACARNLRALGFTPDIIIGHHGWGELLDLPDVWPGVPMLGYFEFYYSHTGQDVGFDPEFPTGEDQFSRIRAMNVVNLLALSLEQHGQTPTQWQYTRYPEWLRGQIRVLPEGARLDICRPDAKVRAEPLTIGKFTIAPKDRLVTYVVRNLEPYRGFHVIMRALPDLLRARPDVKVVMVGGDDVSYGARLAGTTWREHMQKELAGKYDASRVLMPGQVPYETYLRLLQRSDAHVYLTYPFVPSWSLREALACGAVVIGADVEPVREFITDGRNGLLAPPLDPKRLGELILTVLEDDRLARRLRSGARRFAERHLDMATHIAAYEAIIGELTGTTREVARVAARA